MTSPDATVRIALDQPPGGGTEARDIRESLSAVAQAGPHLWLGCDETCTLERVTDLGGGRWGEHRTFPLADVLDLPGPDDGEVDVEGLAWEPPYLWIVGSHGRKRGKPNPKDGVDKAFAKLADVDLDDNRYLLARVPLEDDPQHGGLVPRRACPHPDDPSVTLTAARLRGKGMRSALIRAIRDDEHLRRYLKVPGKDNGFDVEGLASAGGRLFLGLRGPVVRGWAVVLEVEPRATDRPERLRLRRIGPDGRRYRKHFLDLDGLGVRELAADGDDLLVLAGPTMDVRAPATLFRWRRALKAEADSITGHPRLERLMDLPHDVDGGSDHPEGICLLRGGAGGGALLVVYDGSGPGRTEGDAVVADVFTLPRRRGLLDAIFPPRTRPDDRAGKSDDHPGESVDRVAQSDDRAGDSDDRAGESDDHAGESVDRAAESDDHAGESDDHVREPDEA